MKVSASSITMVTASFFVLVACGGGSTNGSSGSNQLTGTAAIGTAVVGGTITVYDATGVSVATGVTGSRGVYSLPIPVNAKSPLVIELSSAGQLLYAAKVNNQPGVANINQLTHATVAMLSSSGDPSRIVAEVASGSASINQSDLDTKVAMVNAAVKPVLSALAGAEQPIGSFVDTAFVADGSGIDKLLDSSLVSVTAALDGSSTISNVEISFNIARDLDTSLEPQAVTFKSTDTVEAIAASADSVTITQQQLPTDQLGTLYDNFLTRMNACYALPKAQRVSDDTTISAQACKDIFFNSDPSQFKDGGLAAHERFKALTSSTAAITVSKAFKPIPIHNIKQTAGVLSGRAVLAFVGEDDEGNKLNSTLVTKIFTLNGAQVLGALGDQNDAEFYVSSEAQIVNHPLAPDTAYDYVRSSYAVYAPNVAPENKSLKMATLETPKKDANGARFKIVLGKRGSRSNLYICKINELDNPSVGVYEPKANTDCTASPNIIQGFRYLNQALVDQGKSPIELPGVRNYMVYSKTDTDSPIARTNCPAYLTLSLPCPRSDEEIESQLAGGLWSLTYHYTDGSKSQPLHARNLVRALSNRELLAATGPDAKAAKLTATTIARFKMMREAAVADGRAPINWVSKSNGDQSPIWVPSVGGLQFDWTVGQAQDAPRQVYMAGSVGYFDDGGTTRWWDRGYHPAFDEKRRFKSSLRTATLECTLSDISDVSCSGVVGTWVDSTSPLSVINQAAATSTFAQGAWMSYSSLWTKDANQRNLTRAYNWYHPE